MRNLFFSIYGGIFISVILVITGTYYTVQKINSYRYRLYLEETSQLTAALINNGISRQETPNKARWLTLVSSLIDVDYQQIQNPEHFYKGGVIVDEQGQYQLVVGPSEHQPFQVLLSINDFSEAWLSTTAFLTLNELGHYPLAQREMQFSILQSTASYTVERAARTALPFSTKQLRSLNRGDVIFTRTSHLGHQESIKAYSSWGSTADVLVLGPIQYFDRYPIKILMPALVIMLLLIAIIVWLLLEHLRRRVMEIHQTVDAIGPKPSADEANIDSSDSITALNSKISSMASRIDKLLEEQAYMVRAISHDLRTPIAKLHFRLESIHIALGEDSQLITQCQEDISQLDALIDELLKYEHLSTQPDIAFSKLNLSTLLAHEIDEVSHCFAHINFAFKTHNNTNVWLNGNEVLIKRLLSNILINAGKYAATEVEVLLTLGKQDITLVIQDDGSGFDNHMIKDIFKPFYQADKARSFNNGSYGLGLAICKQIVTQHQGTILASNQASGGANVTVILPLAG